MEKEDIAKAVWNSEDFVGLIEFLKRNSDAAYDKFNRSLIPDANQSLGVRIPFLRSIAAEIARGDYRAFLDCSYDFDLLEIDLLTGFVIGKIKDPAEAMARMEQFLPRVKNWAVCDTFCNSMKIAAEHGEQFFAYAAELLKSAEPYRRRVGLVLLLSHFVTPQYIDRVLEKTVSTPSEEYYVMMANAWLVSVCYVKFQEKTEKLFKEKLLAPSVNDKAISKIRDSFRVSREVKESLKAYITGGKK